MEARQKRTIAIHGFDLSPRQANALKKVLADNIAAGYPSPTLIRLSAVVHSRTMPARIGKERRL